jgi:FkbM family methyltransferase
MGSEKSLDVKIARFCLKILNFYIKKRTFVKPLPTEDEIWNSLFETNNYIIHKLENDIKLQLYKDSILCRLIYFGFEEKEITFIKRFLKNGDVLLDIGSNIGLFSLYASQIVGNEGQIYAIEPTPETFKRLEGNINLNLFKNIRTFNIGLSNEKATLKFNISNDGHDAWNSFAKLNELENSSSVEVEVTTLDSFLNENNIIHIDLVKLDVEGWEKFVLQGGKELITKSSSPVFMIEFTEENAFAAGYYCGEIYDVMKKYGYQWYTYDVDNNELDKEEKRLHYPYNNLIAVKNIEDCNNRIKNQ